VPRVADAVRWLAVALAFVAGSVTGAEVLPGIELHPEPIIEHGPLRVRLVGPFPQPAPILSVRAEAGQILVRTYFEDYGYPNLPPVPQVEASITAPAAGRYDLVRLSCSGNAPPPSPPCSVVARGTIDISQVPAIPAGGAIGWTALALGLVALATHPLRRASN
jgi:hypothetical protein